MKSEIYHNLPKFIEILGLDEEPMGCYFTDQPPETGVSPDPLDLPTREKEVSNVINWGAVFGGFSCVMGNIWRARRKNTAAFFSAERFGCPGGAFWLGYMKPQTDTIIHYVSSGIQDHMEGEFYCESPEALGEIFAAIDPHRGVMPQRYSAIHCGRGSLLRTNEIAFVPERPTITASMRGRRTRLSAARHSTMKFAPEPPAASLRSMRNSMVWRGLSMITRSSLLLESAPSVS